MTMNKLLLTTLMGSVLFLGVISRAGAALPGDIDTSSMAGVFEISQKNPVHTIINAKTDKFYRICVGKIAAGLVMSSAVKVNHDGGTTMVYPGNCSDFEAKIITVSSPTPLDGENVLIGRFHHISEPYSR